MSVGTTRARRGRPKKDDVQALEAVRQARIAALQERRNEPGARIMGTDLEKLRSGLRDYLQQANTTPAQIAAAAQLKTPNAIYNFLNGHSQNLSAAVWERLQAVAPGLTVQPPEKRPAVQIRAVAQAGVVHDSARSAAPALPLATVPLAPSVMAHDAFGVFCRLGTLAENDLYPDNTLLVAVPPAKWIARLRLGDKVILQRIVNRQAEITVRRVDGVATSKTVFLVDNASEPEVICMPWPFREQPWTEASGRQRFRVLGKVILACVPEAAV